MIVSAFSIQEHPQGHMKKFFAMAKAKILASGVRLYLQTSYCIPKCEGGVDPLCEAGIAVPKSSSSCVGVKKQHEELEDAPRGYNNSWKHDGSSRCVEAPRYPTEERVAYVNTRESNWGSGTVKQYKEQQFGSLVPFHADVAWNSRPPGYSSLW